MAKNKLKLGTINISDPKNDTVVIDIEGVIGIPEWWQFDNPEEKTSTHDKFSAQVSKIANLKVKNLEVNIRSLGGYVDDALLIHAAICGLKDTKVTTICYGYTASAATLIAQAGKTRKITSNSLYLTHRCIMLALGNANDMREALSSSEATDEVIAGLYADRSGEPIETFKELINRNNGNGEWLTPNKVLELKLADEVIKLTSSVNLDVDLLAEFKYPEIPEDLLLSTNFDVKEENLLNRLLDESRKIFQPINTNSKSKPTMKKEWKSVNQVLKVEGLEEKEGSVNLTSEQVQALDGEITDLGAKLETATNDKTKAENDVKEKDQRIKDLEAEVETLKKTPGANSNPVKKETDEPSEEGEDDFSNTIKNSRDLFGKLPD
jgi:ATP-dependent protease ClpP protease subunit